MVKCRGIQAAVDFAHNFERPVIELIVSELIYKISKNLLLIHNFYGRKSLTNVKSGKNQEMSGQNSLVNRIESSNKRKKNTCIVNLTYLS